MDELKKYMPENEVDKALIYAKENLTKIGSLTLGRHVYVSPDKTYMVKIATQNLGIQLNIQESKITSSLALPILVSHPCIQIYQYADVCKTEEELNTILAQDNSPNIYRHIQKYPEYHLFASENGLDLSDCIYYDNLGLTAEGNLVYINYGMTEEVDKEAVETFLNSTTTPVENNTPQIEESMFEIFDEDME